MSKCENCIHEEVCNGALLYPKAELNCDHFKDKSLFVELPCKVGQICYKPYNFMDKVYECRVSSLTQKADGSWKIRLTHSLYKGVFEITTDKIGKTVFLTKEEAERKLREVGE